MKRLGDDLDELELEALARMCVLLAKVPEAKRVDIVAILGKLVVEDKLEFVVPERFRESSLAEKTRKPNP